MRGITATSQSQVNGEAATKEARMLARMIWSFMFLEEAHATMHSGQSVGMPCRLNMLNVCNWSIGERESLIEKKRK